MTPAPVTPAPVTPAPVTPVVTPAPTTPALVNSPQITPAPVTPAPMTPAPTTSVPVTPTPATPVPTTPTLVNPTPVTPAPVTPAPVTPAPVTPAPVTPTPGSPAPRTSVCPPGSDTCGDPHLQGLRGQRFDWSGVDGGWYSLVKDETFDIHVNVRVTAPMPVEFPERHQLITGLGIVSEGHSVVIEVKDPYTVDTHGCLSTEPSPCLANGGLRVLVDGD
ncbi:unnamed protein product [Scytosiphon promiscuus]